MKKRHFRNNQQTQIDMDRPTHEKKKKKPTLGQQKSHFGYLEVTQESKVDRKQDGMMT